MTIYFVAARPVYGVRPHGAKRAHNEVAVETNFHESYVGTKSATRRTPAA
jgi:hypothetical protein